MAKKPSLLLYLGLVAFTLLALRISLPAAAGHPVGRVFLLVVAVLLVTFGAALLFRIRRL